MDTLNLLFYSSLDALSRFTLGLEAMCLIHMADVLQYSAFASPPATPSIVHDVPTKPASATEWHVG